MGDIFKLSRLSRKNLSENVNANSSKGCLSRHSLLKVEKINTWGLVYTWEGSDPDLKPSCHIPWTSR